jgi:very-short-patch-repair endonuclease
MHCCSLPDDEVCEIDGIPVTSVPRTLLDLAPVLSRHRLETVLNEVEVRGLTDGLSIPDLLARYPRRPGTAALRALLRDRATVRGVTRSELEGQFAEILRRSGLRRPRFNADVAVSARFFRADCLWDEQRVIVELDGRRAHGTERAFENDRERDRLLLVEGWKVVRITWRQLRDEAPAVVADLRRLLRE